MWTLLSDCPSSDGSQTVSDSVQNRYHITIEAIINPGLVNPFFIPSGVAFLAAGWNRFLLSVQPRRLHVFAVQA